MAVRQSTKTKLALCTIAYREKLLDYALDVASELGVDGVEIWGREPHISEKFDENRVRTARKMVESRGLQIPAFGSYLGFGITRPRTDEIIQLDATLHIARCLGAPVVRVWASDIGSAQADETVWTKTVREIRLACARAAKLGITLAAEMHSGTLADTGDSARRLVEMVGRENFGLNFQVSQYALPETCEQRLEAVLAYVVHVHAQNYDRLLASNDDSLQHVPLSSGVIDYESLLPRLIEAGYNGYIAVAFAHAKGKDKKQALLEDIGYLQTLCRRLRR